MDEQVQDAKTKKNSSVSKTRDTFVFYKDWFEAIRGQPDETRLEVYDAIMLNALYNEDAHVSPIAQMALNFILPQLARDKEKYMSICERRKEYGRRGGLSKSNDSQQKEAKATNSKLKVANATDNDTDNNTDNDKVYVNDNDLPDTEVSMSKKKSDKDTSLSKKTFEKPSLEEVATYVKEKGYHFDVQSFYEYYEADDWHYNRNSVRKKIKNWKRCCVTWENNWRQSHSKKNEQELEPPASDSLEEAKKFFSWGKYFETEEEAGLFAKMQTEIYEGMREGKYKPADRSVEKEMEVEMPMRLVGKTIYCYEE